MGVQTSQPNTECQRKENREEKGKLSRKNKEVGIAHVSEAGWPWRMKKKKNPRWQGSGGLPLPLYSLSASRRLAPLSVIYNT